MNEAELRAGLAEIALGGLRYFASIGSTNDEGQKWSEHNAPDLSLVVADEQTAGRGRSGGKWFTPAGRALGFSLILRPTPPERSQPAHLSALGALAIAEALHSFRLEPQITVAQGDPQADTLLGLESDGSLRLQSDNKILTIHFGDIHLRPSNDNIS